MLTLPRAIHLLIEERARAIANLRVIQALNLHTQPTDADLDQARREIEREHLTTKATT